MRRWLMILAIVVLDAALSLLVLLYLLADVRRPSLRSQETGGGVYTLNGGN